MVWEAATSKALVVCSIMAQFIVDVCGCMYFRVFQMCPQLQDDIEHVDIIISDFMGYFLLYESRLTDLLQATAIMT
eukprot:1884138-Amphidinium_carterae.1